MTFKIAGEKTNDDWDALKSDLLVATDSKPWHRAVDEFFRERLKTRYIVPIQRLIEDKANVGEGFSIVAIQRSLIEYFESTRLGKLYRHGAPESDTVYSNSSAMFVSFLVKREPFSAYFREDVALDFYRGVRCGVLHEARTKSGWLIQADSETESPIDAQKKVLYRNTFQSALERYIDIYSDEVLHDLKLQAAFIRKFDDFAHDEPA